MMKRLKPLQLFALGATLVAVGGGGTYAFLAFFGGGNPSKTAQPGAEFIPQEAIAAMSFATDAERWRQLSALGTPESQAQLEATWQQWRDRLFPGEAWNYETDVQPWLGKEITVGFLPNQTPEPGESQTALLVVMPVANQKVWDSLKEQQFAAWVESDYQGTPLLQNPEQTEGMQAATLLDDRFVVMSTDPAAVEQAIVTEQDGTSIATLPGYAQRWEQINEPDPLMRLFINVPTATALAVADPANPTTGQDQAAPEGDRLQQTQGVASNITLQPEGLRLQGISWLKPDSERTHATGGAPIDLLDRLSADTVMVAAGDNLLRLWEAYSEGAQANPVSPLNPEWLRQAIASTIGLDLDADLLPWMNGEVAIALVSAPEDNPSAIPGGLVLMVETRNRKQAEDALARIDEAMANKYQFQIEETRVQNQPAINWRSPFGGFLVTRGWLENDVAFLVAGAPLADQLLTQPPEVPLNELDLYAKTASPTLKPRNGYFFANLDSTVNSTNPLAPQLPPTWQAWASGIRAIGITSSVADERSTRYDIVVVMKQVDAAPAPQPEAGTEAPPVQPPGTEQPGE